MSYKSYNNYLGSNRCCNTNSSTSGSQGAQGAVGAIGPAGTQGVTGAQGSQGATGIGCRGPQGVPGPAGGAQGVTGAQGLIGETGSTGSTGSQGFIGETGATGAQGAQGATGATGGSPWFSTNAIGGTASIGYTGTGYTGDVLIFGNLLVTGGIDPTYLALTPQTSGPTGFINPLWVDSLNGNALRSQKIYMDNTSGTGNTGAYISLIPDSTNQIILNDGAAVNDNSNIINYSSMTISDTLDTLAINKNNITHSNATTGLTIGSNNAIDIYTPNNNIGISTTYTSLILDDINKNIYLGGVGSTLFNIDLSSNLITMYGGSGIDLEAGNGSGVGNINLTANDAITGKINVNATNGIVINQQGVIPPDTTTTTLNGNNIEIFEDKNTSLGLVNQLLINTAEIYIDNTDNTAFTDSYCRLAPNLLEIYDHTSSGTNNSRLLIGSTELEYQRSGTKPTYFEFRYLSTPVFRMNANGINMGSAGTGVQLRSNLIQYPATYNTASATLTTTQNVSTSNAVQTFNGSSLTATLPNASATNVGIQYTITNTNASNLTVTTVGGTQLIYSSTGAASATSRTLGQGNSHIFTAIQTTGASTFGWSMV